MNNILIYECGVCLNARPKRLLWLFEHETELALKYLRVCSKNIQSHHKPRKACENCFKKLYLFKKLLSNLILYQLKKEKINGIMQEAQEPTTGNKVAPIVEEKQIKHEYNCNCLDCQNKHGNLPLLIEVMEHTEAAGTGGAALAVECIQPSTSANQQRTKNKKKFFCNHCEKNFTHKGDYNKHLRKHTGDQPFSCPTCHRKFAHTSNLHRHLRLHSGDKPFACENCNKRFHRKDKLDSHMKSKFCKKNLQATTTQ